MGFCVCPTSKKRSSLKGDFIPNLIVCDPMMPGLDGIEFLQRQRSQPETEIIPFVFLTGKGTKTRFAKE